MSRRTSFAIPEALRTPLAALTDRLHTGVVPHAPLRDAITQLHALPPAAVVRLDRELADLAQLHHFSEAWLCQLPPERQRSTDAALLLANPDLKHLFLFHRDGRLREAALQRFTDGAPSPLIFTAIAYRLNDWAEPVRQAAQACAARVFPRTTPDIVVTASLFLSEHMRHWRRWRAEAAVLDAALARADVIEHLATFIATATSGPMASLLRRALRHTAIDRHLPRLASDAAQPAVRAIALQCLIDGRATWPTGFRREWIDKRFGLSRRVVIVDQRPVDRGQAVEALVAQAARDRAASVRRIAAMGLVAHHASMANAPKVIEALARDRNRAIRDRVAFVLSQRAPVPGSGG